jgi:hypothetical protein
MTKENLIWLVCFNSIKLESKNLNLMFCVDSETKNIITWLTGFNPITTQNLIKNLERAMILENVETQIVIDREAKHCNTKSYKKFAENHSDFGLVDIEKIKYEKTMQWFLKAFQENPLEGKTLKETLDNDSYVLKTTSNSAKLVIAKYISNGKKKVTESEPKQIFIDNISSKTETVAS